MAASTADGGIACATPVDKPFIRTITAFISLSNGVTCEAASAAAARAAALTSHISTALRGAGFTVQTRRIASSCFLNWASTWATGEPAFALPVVQSFLAAARRSASDCPAPLLVCLGRMPARALAADAGLVDRVVSLLGSNSHVSMSADLQAGDRAAADACARLVKGLSRAGAGDGMANFQFCVSCNVPPCTPFFPAAYAPEPELEESEPQLRFGIGLQHGALAAAAATAAAVAAAADPAANVISLFEAELTRRLDAVCAEIAAIVQPAAVAFKFAGTGAGVEATASSAAHSSDAEGAAGGAGASAAVESAAAPVFVGIDTSLAPAPGEVPLTTIYESLGVRSFGGPGTLEVSAAITRALQGVRAVPRVGYCGLMLPPLEDTGLSHAVTCGDFTLRDILLHSTVCGIGWDTVPIAGDAGAADIAALFRDVAALSAKWSKPLSARLFPVPGLEAGQMTDFDSPYLTNTAVMKL